MLAAAFVLALALQASSPDCAYDRTRMLDLDLKSFDQTLGGGWRLVGERDGCEAAGADLIAAYRAAHVGEFTNGLNGLLWHEGQLRAAAGDSAGAVRLLWEANQAGGIDTEYALATIAFLERDRAALLAARERYAAQPKPDWFEKSAANYRSRFGGELNWPPNLAVVDGLIACFDKPYAEAYRRSCRPATPP